MTDLLIIGGGAAGLMAAGAACARGLRVTVLEHNPKGPGQKLLITGKGRCNVTSDSDVREFLPYVRHNGRFLYSSLYAFPPAAAMELFESLGVPLKTERGRRVFPQSDRAADILAALRSYARDAEFLRGSARKLLMEDGICKGAVTDRGQPLTASATLRMMLCANCGSRMMAEPQALPQTTRAGQPKFMSMILAPHATAVCAAEAISNGSAPSS